MLAWSTNGWVGFTNTNAGSPDDAFAEGQLAAAEVRLANGTALFELDDRPIAAEANRGRSNGDRRWTPHSSQYE